MTAAAACLTTVAQYSDQIAMAARLYSQDAETAVLVVESDPLDPVRFSQSG